MEPNHRRRWRHDRPSENESLSAHVLLEKIRRVRPLRRQTYTLSDSNTELQLLPQLYQLPRFSSE
jgi:hypothetical protein